MQGINSLYYSTAMRPRMARGGITSIRQPYGFGSFVRKAVKAITKPVAKVLDKVVPNEIKPALPYIAAAFPFLAPTAFGSLAASMPGFGIQNAFIQQAVQRGLLGAGLNTLSQLSQEGNEGDINLLRAVAAGVPAAFTTPGLSANLGANAELIREAAGTSPSLLSQVQSGGLEALSKVAEFGQAGAEAPLFSLGKVQALAAPLGQQTTFDAMDFAKQAQLDYEKQLAEYNQMLTDEGLAQEASDQGRAEAIYNSMVNAGAFTTDTIRETLDQLGLPSNFFAGGGRVKKAEGGLMNLRMGGMPAEIDARQAGGFIPIGKAEKADDVPARLSQNEFVMTADAVRGMGQGDINLGAQRMYNIMKQYEPIGKALV